jgi:hypothetical protein
MPRSWKKPENHEDGNPKYKYNYLKNVVRLQLPRHWNKTVPLGTSFV